ncbi:MAG: mechanosensitive ion channel family protein [Chitinophagales bacterium]|nr:mechanosensitive ion channel family protein [Chitinophagales bacterium]
MEPVLTYHILDNSLKSILIFLAVILVALLLKRYLSKILSSVLHRVFYRFEAKSSSSEFHLLLLRPLQFLIVLLIIFMGLQTLNYPGVWKIKIWNHDLHDLLSKLMLCFLLISLTWVFLRIVDFISFLLKERATRSESRLDNQLIPFIKDLLKVFILINAAFILLGGIFHFDVTSLLAGIGIGGLAIAFAAQESIKDLFGSFTIFLDKPFTVGDLVRIGDVTGTVERVSIRSTRLRSIDKTLITMPNKKMVDLNVDNLSLATLRHVNLTVRLTYETAPDKLRNIIAELREYFNQPALFQNEHFVIFDEYGESSLNIRIEYFTPMLPWADFLTQKEAVNFRIMEVVHKHGGLFAYPVRDVRIDPQILHRITSGFDNRGS